MEPRAENRVGQIRARLGETPDREVLRRRAHAESGELREDEPHPVRAFPPAADLGEYVLVHSILRADEPLEVMWITGHPRIINPALL